MFQFVYIFSLNSHLYTTSTRFCFPAHKESNLLLLETTSKLPSFQTKHFLLLSTGLMVAALGCVRQVSIPACGVRVGKEGEPASCGQAFQLVL